MRNKPIRKVLLLLLISFISIYCSAQTASSHHTEYTQLTEVLFSVVLNSQDINETILFLKDSADGIYINQKNLEQWNIVVPETAAFMPYENEIYINLSNLAGVQYQINNKEMQINLTVPTQYFKHTQIDLDPGFIHPTPSPPGASVSYDFFAQNTNTNYQLSGLFNTVAFNRYGALSSGFLAQGTNNTTVNGDNSTQNSTFDLDSGFIRLNTTFEKDNPSKMKSLLLGDSFSTPGMWGRSVGFGGFQWGTNFGTQPQFVTFPLPTTRGEAVVPTIVDLYVNDSLVGQKDLPSGPFTLNNIPAVTGAGNINLVTTDILGRQQMTTLPYYTSNVLLQRGLTDSSYQAGFIRDNFGINSNDYGRFMLVGTDRKGFSDQFTGELHGELLTNQQTLGLGADYLVGQLGVLNASLAASNSMQGSNNPHGAGGLIDLGFQRQTLKGISYGADAEYTANQFTQVGLQDGDFAPAFQGRFSLSFPLRHRATIGTAFIQQTNRGTPNVSLVNVSYNQSFLTNWALTATALTNVSGPNNKTFYLSISRAIGSQTSMNIGATAENDANQGFAQVIHNLPRGPGYGYNLYAAGGQQQSYQALGSAQNNVGTYSIGAAQQSGTKGYQADVSGGAVWLDHHVYFTRDIGQSFAVVQVPGYPNVEIFSENQSVGRTDSAGNLLVPNILPYYLNSIRLEPNDLPLDAEINTTELSAIPYINSGVITRFAVTSTKAAIIHLKQDSGEEVPPGSTVKFIDHVSAFSVGTEGELYASGFASGDNELEADWYGQRCRFTVIYPETTAVMPDLGEIICRSN